LNWRGVVIWSLQLRVVKPCYGHSRSGQANRSVEIEPLAGDVTDRAAMAAAVRFIEAEISPIALAFLNVGIFEPDAGDFGGDGFRRTSFHAPPQMSKIPG
jgi:hypothetical protein